MIYYEVEAISIDSKLIAVIRMHYADKSGYIDMYAPISILTRKSDNELCFLLTEEELIGRKLVHGE